MEVIARFILDRDDKNFCYVEKIEDRKQIKYRVYFDRNTVKEYNQDNFHAIFSSGPDVQMSVSKFAENAQEILIRDSYEDDIKRNAYEFLGRILVNEGQNKNKRKPNVISIKDLVQATMVYNEELKKQEDVELDYAWEWKVLQNNKINNAELKSNELIDSYNKNLAYDKFNADSYRKGIERRIKYDN